jgi:hypothetical protein
MKSASAAAPVSRCVRSTLATLPGYRESPAAEEFPRARVFRTRPGRSEPAAQGECDGRSWVSLGALSIAIGADPGQGHDIRCWDFGGCGGRRVHISGTQHAISPRSCQSNDPWADRSYLEGANGITGRRRMRFAVSTSKDGPAARRPNDHASQPRHLFLRSCRPHRFVRTARRPPRRAEQRTRGYGSRDIRERLGVKFMGGRFIGARPGGLRRIGSNRSIHRCSVILGCSKLPREANAQCRDHTAKCDQTSQGVSAFAARYDVTVMLTSTGRSSSPGLPGGPRSSKSSTTIGVSDRDSANRSPTRE